MTLPGTTSIAVSMESRGGKINVSLTSSTTDGHSTAVDRSTLLLRGDCGRYQGE
jgi:hypothetical protein